MKLLRVIAPLLVVAAVATAAFASAAKLNVNSSQVQAGSVRITGCQGDAAISLSYGTHYDSSISAFLIDTVTVSGIGVACQPAAGAAATHTVHVVLTFTPPGSQDIGTQPITGSSVSFSLPAGSQPAVSDLSDAHALIN